MIKVNTVLGENEKTNQTVLEFVSKVTESFHNDEYMCWAFFFVDLCKAFDTIDHKILYKLEFYGVLAIMFADESTTYIFKT